MKNTYAWIWRWHFIGGIVALPFVILLSVTGVIYLFREDYEKDQRDHLKNVEVLDNPISYQQQWQLAQTEWEKEPTSIVVSSSDTGATEFVSGRFSHKSSLFIDPYRGVVNGKIQQNQTDMHTVRKLHGELLMGAFGTKVVELVACWMVVLTLTGLYLFWPRERGWKSLFTVRTSGSRRVLFRDLHGLSGFWFSILVLLILGGGLPWTDIWGSGFKWVQNQTDTGFPATWQARNFSSKPDGRALSLDEMINQVKSLNLPGEVSITLPKSPEDVYSVSNQTSDLGAMVMIHFDQYSGEVIHQNTWDDVGILMKARLWLMAFHQGQFGSWNFFLVMLTAIGLTFMSITALFSYLRRKKRKSWSVPPLPAKYNFSKGLLILIIALGILLPVFGITLLLMLGVERLLKRKKEARVVASS